MLSAGLFLGGGALLCWPSSRSDCRLVSGLRRPFAGFRMPSPRRSPAPIIAALAAVAVLLGPAPALALGLLAAAGRSHWRARERVRAELATTAALAEALRTMVAELRAGAHPALAAESAAAEAPAPAATLMRAVAGSARLGGQLGDLPRTESSGPVRSVLERLTGAWALTQRHGLPMAEVLDAVRRDVSAGVRFRTQLQARLAGPRASALVLACLPVVGVALGEAMGAHPAHVLFTSTPGQVLLVLGCALLWAGTGWTARLTAPVVVR
jgi:tight adherence protein B